MHAGYRACMNAHTDRRREPPATPGEMFVSLLRRNGLDQNTLAKRAGVAASTVSRIAQGQRPSMKTLDALAPHLNVSVAELLDVFRTGTAPAAPPVDDPVRKILRDLADMSIPKGEREFLVEMLGVAHAQWLGARRRWGSGGVKHGRGANG